MNCTVRIVQVKVNKVWAQLTLKSKQNIATFAGLTYKYYKIGYTVKILKIGTPKIITTIVLQLEQLDFTVQ